MLLKKLEKVVEQKKTLVLVMEVSSFVLFLAKLKSLAKNMCSKNRECRVMAIVKRFVPTPIKTPLLLHGMEEEQSSQMYNGISKQCRRMYCTK